MAKSRVHGPSGLLVINKPAGMTSHDVVSQMRWIAGTRRVGHAGTLDPAATGVLILGLNKATKLLTYLVGQDKTYTARIIFGATTLTEDAEGELTSIASSEAVAALAQQQIEDAVRSLTGDMMQVPSAVSALKVKGVRSYARVRSGEEVELAPRPVTIYNAQVHEVCRRELDTSGYGAAQGLQVPETVPVVEAEVTISCSSGTYIRAFARDLGEIVGTGAHLGALDRIRVGEFTQEDSLDLAALLDMRQSSGEPLTTLPMLTLEQAARRLFAVRELSAQEATDVSLGRRLEPSGKAGAENARVSSGESPSSRHAKTAGITAGFAPDGTLVGLLEDRSLGKTRAAAPILVFESGVDFSRKAGEQL